MKAEWVLTRDEALAAFDGDFEAVSFDHKPTAGDVMAIKLTLVSKEQIRKLERLGLVRDEV